MSIDGVFINKLVKELQTINNHKINKVIGLNDTDFVFMLPRKNKLIISIDSNHPHLRLSSNDIISSTSTTSFYNSLKRNIENNIIESISQYHNDRIIIIKTKKIDELGFYDTINLYIELMGRNSNIIITNNDNIIIDCFKKSSLDSSYERILVNKAKYVFPNSQKINPFTTKVYNYSVNVYEGISSLLFEEIMYMNDLNIINQEINPVIIKTNNKYFFYCFDLIHLQGEKTFYKDISSMLDSYYTMVFETNIKNYEQKLIEDHIKKETTKLSNKISKLSDELRISKDNLIYEKYGNLLSTYLYQIKPNMKEIEVFDYYDNKNIFIELDPSISAVANLNNFYSKYKKSKRAISFLEKQIEIANKDLEYYYSINEQLSISKNLDLKEIIDELGLKGNTNKVKTTKKSKPNITVYQDIFGNTIFVGKNNIQNNYLTHTLALKTDYFFHVKSIGGSHVILRMNNNCKDSMQLAADIATYYSKFKSSVNANVDCTLVKNIKKVPGTKGSYVTYNTYNTFFGNGDINKIKERIKS